MGRMRSGDKLRQQMDSAEFMISLINKKLDKLLAERVLLEQKLSSVNHRINCGVKAIKLYETELINNKEEVTN